ncbi:MAG: hypothetical protein PHS82_14675 [Lachnospiraceae bacterium]|nr:hypothetical protein [Lachnospiraceae bacterium]
MNIFQKFIPFWEILSEDEKRMIQTNSHQIDYEKGMQMRQCDQGCNGILLILSGQMRAFIVSEEGREVTLFRVFQDEVCVLSAAGLLDAIVFDVMVDAVEDSTVMMIPVHVLECQTANYNRVQQQIKIPSDTYQTARSCL